MQSATVCGRLPPDIEGLIMEFCGRRVGVRADGAFVFRLARDDPRYAVLAAIPRSASECRVSRLIQFSDARFGLYVGFLLCPCVMFINRGGG